MNVLSCQHVKALIDQTITLIDGTDTEYAMTLIRIDEHEGNGETIDDQLVENFSLVLKGPKDTRFPQGNYLLSHPDLGEQILHMLPAAEDTYTITINTRA
ncbi:hypothetical protein [Salinivibrio sp. YCSC6]|uniref:DUF6916 family protein n=1 Tax=Salinivibrio sp. YCSC6 TaxID=2003370 RepID=UPI000BBBF642|nr:hypothetical protein [Salinivibrio sp. YCSC6]PCE65490.1 hypothetical protein B6G00_16100 [Salinivibrio sp. YCSC6]QCF37478.1 hypothetical protein E8E00_14750 [Salinivibrio sp. YCSC6]